MDNTPLSRNSIQDSVVNTSALSDKGFLQTFWNQSDGAEMTRQISNESYFLNSASSATNNYFNPSMVGHQRTIESSTSSRITNSIPKAYQYSRSPNRSAGTLERPGALNQFNMSHQNESKSDDDEMPLAVQLYSLR